MENHQTSGERQSRQSLSSGGIKHRALITALIGKWVKSLARSRWMKFPQVTVSSVTKTEEKCALEEDDDVLKLTRALASLTD